MKLERKKLRIYNPELGKLPGVKIFILFNIVIGAFVITPFLSIYSNVVTEFGVTTQAWVQGILADVLEISRPCPSLNP